MIDWGAEPDTQREFEQAAVEAARGWIAALSELADAKMRILDLEAQREKLLKRME